LSAQSAVDLRYDRRHVRYLTPSHAVVFVLVCVAAAVLALATLPPAPVSRVPPQARQQRCSVVVHSRSGLVRTIAAAAPGGTICLQAADYDVGRLTIRRPGRAGARITLRSSIPWRPATIHGAIYLADSANYWTFENLRLDGRNRWNMPSPMVSGDHSIWRQVDVTNHHAGAGVSGGGICFSLGQTKTYGYAGNTTIEHSRIHDCGVSDNHNHGIYITATSGLTIIRDNWIYRNGDRGIQLYPAAANVLITHNTIDSNGSGVIFGGLGSLTSHNVAVVGNIISNSRNRWNVESWYPPGTPVGTANLVAHNCLWASNSNSQYDTNGGIAPPIGFTIGAANVTQRPDFRVARLGIPKRSSEGGCRGFGPRGAQS
jgi:parallel beta-helix repeat protein